jgi:aminopeptidase N
VKFPLPKQDMIAIPDFGAGAMENWGLITYRETALLYKEGVSAASNKQRIAIVVSHELAHQWFGNLVTPSWWTDLWLNEGFASYVEYLGVEEVQPELKLLEQFVVQDLQVCIGRTGRTPAMQCWQCADGDTSECVRNRRP